MDILTNEECQAIIDGAEYWEPLDIVKQDGSKIQCQQSKCTIWSNEHPTVLHEYLMKYEVGDFATKHTDSFWRLVKHGYVAHTTWITPLNDDYEGGDLIIGDEVVEQVVGVPIEFELLTPHEITEITTGTRYSLVSWFFGPGERK